MAVAHRGLALGLLIGAVSASEAASGQVTPYVVTHDMGGFTPLSSGTIHVPVAYGSQDAWDEGAARIPLPFDFEFFGRRYREIWAFTNGFLSFEPPPPNVTVIGPPTAVPRAGDAVDAYIAPMWQDLDRDRTTTPLPPPPRIRSLVTGGAGARTLTIEYAGFKRARSPLSDVNFQVALDEGANRIRVVYGQSFGILNATAALEGAGGTDGFDLHRPSSTCAGNCPCGPASCNSVPNLPNGRRVSVDLPSRTELVGGVFGPPGAAPGSSFEARVVARNAGLAPSGAFDYEVYLSPTSTSTAGASLLGSFRGGPLAALQVETTTRTFVVPPALPASTRYLAVAVDVGREVDEVFEGNNLSFGGPFGTAPELRGRLEIPAQGGPGEPLLARLVVENAGAPVAQAFDVRYWLSTDSVLGADILLATRTTTLPDGFSSSASVDLPIPPTAAPSPPPYRVIAELDASGIVRELDETNNVVVSAGTVDLRGPDLEVVRVESPAVAARGRPIPVEVVVRNNGGAPALGVTACVLVGRAPGVDLLTGLRITETLPFDVSVGGVLELYLEPVVPFDLTPAERYLAGGVDCRRAVLEDLEDDNARDREGGTIEVRAPSADFSVEALAGPTRLAEGEPAELRARIVNRGSAAAAAALVLVASSDAVLDPDDLQLASVDPGPLLEPGAVAELRVAGRLPASLPWGALFLGLVADPADVVDEIEEDDNVGFVGPIPVEGPALAVVGQDPPPAEATSPYAWRFAAVGGGGDRSWSLEWMGGRPPAGIAFDPATAELRGTPEASAEGRHPYVVAVRSEGVEASREGALLVVPPGLPLAIASRQLPPARLDVPYDAALLAVGGAPPYRFRAVDPSAVPSGLEIREATGRLAGAPTLVGAYLFEVEVQDRFDRATRAPVALEVVEPSSGLQIATADVPSGMVGMPYETRLGATGLTGPAQWTLTGRVPGLSLDEGSGVFAGTPAEAGLFPITVTLTEPGTGRRDRAAFVVEVVERGDLFIEGEAALPEGQVGVAYASAGGPVRLRATPDDGGLLWSVLDGALPDGLRLRPDGVIEGTPTAPGAFAFLVQASNTAREARRATRVIRVGDGSAPSEPPADGGCRCLVEGRARPGAPSLGVLLTLGLLLGAFAFRYRSQEGFELNPKAGGLTRRNPSSRAL